MNVLVTGGTGTLGRHVVTRLRQSGHRARILTRNPRGHVDAVHADLNTGAGLDRALAGMDAVVHAATAARQSLAARQDVKGTQRLIDAARDAKIKHLVYISIVGIDGVAYPYYTTKVKCEAAIRGSGLPWSILRATQFHDLMEVLLRAASRIPRILTVPQRWQYQPVDAREVAQKLVDVVLHDPREMLPDFGGPEIKTMDAIARAWLKARGDNRTVVNLPLPFKFNRQFQEGHLLCPDHKDGRITFEQYLEERYPAP